MILGCILFKVLALLLPLLLVTERRRSRVTDLTKKEKRIKHISVVMLGLCPCMHRLLLIRGRRMLGRGLQMGRWMLFTLKKAMMETLESLEDLKDGQIVLEVLGDLPELLSTVSEQLPKLKCGVRIGGKRREEMVRMVLMVFNDALAVVNKLLPNYCKMFILSRVLEVPLYSVHTRNEIIL
jgi:hypothetical protein